MKKIIALVILLFPLSNGICAMFKIDEAIDATDVEWVQKILRDNPLTEEQKQTFLKIAHGAIKVRKQKTKSLFRNRTDMCRLLFGLGVNGFGGLVAICGLVPLACCFAKSESGEFDKSLYSYIKISCGGGLIWLFGLYNVFKGWNMSNAYARLNKAREIEQSIRDVKSVTKQQ